MGVKKSVIDAQIAASAGGPLGYPVYGEEVTFNEDTADSFELLAAPAAGKTRIFGLGLGPSNEDNSGAGGIAAVATPSGTQTITLSIGETVIHEFEMDDSEPVFLPPLFIPAEEALNVDLAEASETHIVGGWSEADASDKGATITELSDSWTTVLGPPPAGKIFVPAMIGVDSFAGGGNLDGIDHGVSVRLFDGVEELKMYGYDQVSWPSKTWKTFGDIMVAPIRGNLRYQMRLQEAVSGTPPVAVIGYNILDEE